MKNHAFSLPNLLTYGRIIAVPLVVLCFFLEGRLKSSDPIRWTACIIFIIASITDFFDGYLARIWKQTSTLGRMLDPIADKLLVSACLLLLAAERIITDWDLWAAIIILCREILVSGLREYLAELKVGMPVSRLAKWKTGVQMVALAFLLIGPAGDKFFPYTTWVGLKFLWIAALLTLLTGWDYCRAGVKHAIK